MSKTYRNIPHWAKITPAEELERYDPRSRRRIERFQKRVKARMDGAFSTELGAADPKSPKGYNTWDEVWGPYRKRREKALTHRTLRRTATIDTDGYEEETL